MATQFFVNGAVFASFLPRLPEIRDRVGIGLGTLGVLLTAAAAFGLLGSAAVGPLIGRFGTRGVLVAGALTMVVVLPLIGVATTPWLLLVALAAMSLLDVLVDVAMNLQGSWLSARRRVPVMNRLHGLWSLGTVAGGLVASQAAATGVPLTAQLTVTSIVLLGAVVYVGRGLLAVDTPHEVAVVEPRWDEVALADAGTGPAAGVGTGDPRDVAGAGEVARRGVGGRAVLVSFGVAGALAVMLEIVNTDWAAFRLGDDLGAGPGLAGLGFVAFTVGMTAGRFLGDSMVVRFGSDRVLRVACVVAFVGVCAATLVPSRWVALAGYGLAGVGVATFFPKLYDDGARLGGRGGAGLGALTAGSRVSMLATPSAVGLLAATRLSVGTAVAVVALPAIVAFSVVATRLADHRR